MEQDSLVLARHEGRLELRFRADRAGLGVCVDFATLSLRGLRTMPLVRACGVQRGVLVDATCGLGGDAWLLAASGWQVVAFERAEPVAEVLRDGLERAAREPALAEIAARIRLVSGDARDRLREVDRPETVYLDPMYPVRKGSALAPKRIRIVRAAVGADEDAAALFEAARGLRPGRIVVKRPHGAAPLAGEPDERWEGKLARFDAYFAQGALARMGTGR